MIADKIERIGLYLPEACKGKIVEFISKISDDIDDIQEGEYPIAGDAIFARVQSYPLRATDTGRCEAHRKYVDIQSVMNGAEGIDVFDLDSLSDIETEYNAENDVIFYYPKDKVYSVAVREHHFAILFPHEAHRPQMAVNENKYVKKYVIKVGVELWNSQR